ncbi:exopolysaccharide biosynthesis polyprenyl glycosylphosphotransferase [bacterium]|nr:exopolysaccharide biosynthesis polyprenyl glycosylphosphotransferase [bacterium]
MNRRYGLLLGWIERIVGLLGLNAAFLSAGYVRSLPVFGQEAIVLNMLELRKTNPQFYDYYVQLWVFFNLLAWVLMPFMRQGDRLKLEGGLRQKFGRSLRVLLMHAVLFALLVVSLKGYYYSRLFGLYFYGFWMLYLLVGDVFTTRLKEHWQAIGKGRVRAWVVGSSPEADRFAQECARHLEWGISVVGRWAQAEVLPTSEIQDAGVDELYLAVEDDRVLLEWQRLADRNLIRVRLLPRVALPAVRSYTLHYLGRNAVVVPREEPLEAVHNRWLKRGLDLVVGLPALVLCAVVFGLPLAIAVKLSSRGPVLFRQSRSGWFDRPFTLYKFRTFAVDGSGPTPVGRFLRRHNLDELPQLWNVVKGEMSLVGPRPHMLEHTSDYRRQLDAFMVRHLIPPGLTGLAQVSGWRGVIDGEESLEERVRADVYYLENWSILLDINILYKTLIQSFFPAERAS